MAVRLACIVVAAAFFLFTGSAAALPFSQAPQQQAREKAPEPVTGALVSLNSDTKSLVIRTTGDTEMKFSFSEETEIVGAEMGAKALTAASGAPVTVTYQIHGTANVATKIEVLPKK